MGELQQNESSMAADETGSIPGALSDAYDVRAMRAFSRKPATYRDLEALPEDLIGELFDGELHATPRPGTAHATAATALTSDLHDAFHRGRSGPGGWWILAEPELHFGGDVLVPDIAGWRRARVPQLPTAAALELVPDWVCEVLSPSTARIDLVLKLPRYRQAGVNHVWILDPLQQTLQVFRREAATWVLASACGGADTIHAEPFEAIALDLSALWLNEAESTETR